MAELAQRLGVSRESLYRSLSADGNPSFATVIGTMWLLGFTLTVKGSAAA